jgi:transposase
VDLTRERDIEQLRLIAQTQQVQIEQLLKVLTQKCRELSALKGNEAELQQTLTLVQELSKKAAAAQQLPPGDAAASQDAALKPAPRKERTKFGPTAQPQLPRVEMVCELDPPDRACPSCGGELAPMAGQFESSEMVDVVDVSYRIVHVQRQKYVCRCGGCVQTAEGPERATPGGRYSLLFAIKVAIDKYLDHLPLSRQERILSRHGIEVSRQALWEQVQAIAKRLALLDEALLLHVKQQPVIGIDQTSWARLEKGADKPWQMWCLTAPGVVVHRIKDDKSAATFTELVGDYRGIMVCDAAKTHEAGARAGPGIVLAGCWAHVFRKFEEAEPDHPEASRALSFIGKLYEIDERAGDDLALRAQLRRTESSAVLAELKSWLWAQAVLKTLSIGKAAAYAIANWDRLTRFADDARVPLDNNQTERAIRGPVVGRRNHFGSKSHRGTEVAATLYSIIETAKLSGLDPAKYLLEAVRAADRGQALMPWDFAAQSVAQT